MKGQFKCDLRLNMQELLASQRLNEYPLVGENIIVGIKYKKAAISKVCICFKTKEKINDAMWQPNCKTKEKQKQNPFEWFQHAREWNICMVDATVSQTIKLIQKKKKIYQRELICLKADENWWITELNELHV